MVSVVSILGGGWSAAAYDRARLPGVVIGVNDAAVRARCDVAVSMDRLWTEWRFKDLAQVFGLQCLDRAWIRRSALSNIAERPAWLKVFENDHNSVDFSDEPGRLNGTNSGMCALNLAYQMRPRRVYLFGFDMNRSPSGEAYWFPAYPWAPAQGATSNGKYRTWAAEMAIARRQFDEVGIDVFNASPGSAIDAFPKIHPKDALL